MGIRYGLACVALLAAQQPFRFLVMDGQTQEPLAGAAVVLLGAEPKGVLTDSTGVATLSVRFLSDTLKVEVRYMGYEKVEVALTARSAPGVEVRLWPEGVQQQEVVITAHQETRTEVALLSALQQMPQIATGLSAQAIQRTPDRTAAAVLTRITGVTVNEGRFLVIRGMNERYNAVLLNRLPVFSTEPESRAFDLEILPAGIIDQVRVYKTPAAYQTGEFGGGVVEVLTRRSQETPTFHLQLRSGYLVGTTFRHGLASVSYPADIWGSGVVSRALPGGFPEDLNALSPAEARAWAQKLPNTFRLRSISALPPNTQGSLTYGVPLTKKLWFLSGLSYGRSFQNLLVERNRYEVRVLQAGANPKLFSYIDRQTTEMVRLMGFTNFLWAPAPGQQVELNLFAARLTENETILREGYSFYQRGTDAFFRNYSMQYLARTLSFLQIGGMHRLSEGIALRWDVGGHATLRDEPDYRRVRTVREAGDSVFRIILPPGPTTFDAARFYSQLRQYGADAQLSLLTELWRWRIVTGMQVGAITRTFSARWFSYTVPSTASPSFVAFWTALPIEEAFSEEYLPQLRLREGTNPTDRYEAQQAVAAAFFSAERTMGRFSIQAGLRYEYSEQRLQSATATQALSVQTPFPLLMPFVSAGWALSPTQKLRWAYSRTLNRPALRELAPFLYYNFALEVQQAGNPALRPATLHNVDIRYELSPSLGQLLAIGLFYKKLIQPIETYILRGADQPTIRFGNAPSAQLVGAEIELRVRLSQTLSLIANGAYVWSQVDMGSAVYGSSGGQSASQARFRPLQGQAPFLGNLLLSYTSRSGRWEVSTAGQLTGPRLWWVGDNFNPSVYEMPRPIWDATFRHKLGKAFYIQLQARDILNTPFVYRQDSDLNGRISRKEDVIFRYVRGSEWSVAMGWQW
jgi:hypothetical protein